MVFVWSSCDPPLSLVLQAADRPVRMASVALSVMTLVVALRVLNFHLSRAIWRLTQV